MSPSRSSSQELSIIPCPAQIGGTPYPLDRLPRGMKHDEKLGVVAPAVSRIQRIHIDAFTCHPRSIRLPSGEYLLFFAAGPMHYGWAEKKCKGNTMYVYRSADAWHWSEPSVAWEIDYSQHAAIPFLSRHSELLYAFGTEPRHDVYDGVENAAIGYRTSADGGRTWTPVELIRPVNAPGFQGMSAMRMCETADGTWLLGSHSGHYWGEEPNRNLATRQFLLRSEDRGKSWTLLPDADGWFVPEYGRMDEGRPLHLGDNRVLFMVRTPTGYLWELRSEDAGRTWSQPRPTTLAHPDAPPMLFHLDEHTLVAFHHNRNVKGKFSHENRGELWASLSSDEGRTWSEPRFVLSNACEPATLGGWGGFTPMVSYADLLVVGDQLHLFIDHQMRQVIQVSFTKQDLRQFPTRSEIGI